MILASRNSFASIKDHVVHKGSDNRPPTTHPTPKVLPLLYCIEGSGPNATLPMIPCQSFSFAAIMVRSFWSWILCGKSVFILKFGRHFVNLVILRSYIYPDAFRWRLLNQYMHNKGTFTMFVSTCLLRESLSFAYRSPSGSDSPREVSAYPPCTKHEHRWKTQDYVRYDGHQGTLNVRPSRNHFPDSGEFVQDTIMYLKCGFYTHELLIWVAQSLNASNQTRVWWLILYKLNFIVLSVSEVCSAPEFVTTQSWKEWPQAVLINDRVLKPTAYFLHILDNSSSDWIDLCSSSGCWAPLRQSCLQEGWCGHEQACWRAHWGWGRVLTTHHNAYRVEGNFGKCYGFICWTALPDLDQNINTDNSNTVLCFL